LLLLLPLVVLAACASAGGAQAGGGQTSGPNRAGDSGTGSDGGIQRAQNDLLVEIDRGDGGPVERYTLTCVGFVEGDLPDAEAACAHLDGLEEPFAPLPADAVCTQQYGGPQTAHVTGLWRGEPVDLELSRTNGCRISQWDRLGPLLPGPVG
jgi:hypothetical protein